MEIYTPESRINTLSIDVWFVMIGQYLKIWNLRVQKNLNIEKISFKVVQMNFLAMHINNQTLSFDIFTVGNLQIASWNMILISNDFGHNFVPYSVLLVIAAYDWFWAPGSHVLTLTLSLSSALFIQKSTCLFTVVIQH